MLDDKRLAIVQSASCFASDCPIFLEKAGRFRNDVILFTSLSPAKVK